MSGSLWLRSPRCCSGARGRSSPPTPNPHPPGEEPLPDPPALESVNGNTVVLEVGAGTSAWINSTGGSLTIRANLSGNATNITLEIPHGMSSTAAIITLTQLADVSSLPENWPFQAGVDFAPDGLRLPDSANLTLELPAGIDIGLPRVLGTRPMARWASPSAGWWTMACCASRSATSARLPSPPTPRGL